MSRRSIAAWPAPLTLSTLLVAALLSLGGCSRQVAVTAPTPDATTAAQCAAVTAALPGTLADEDARQVTPDTGTTAAWGDPPIVLRCGVPVPVARTPTSLLTTVDGVDWFAEPLTEGVLFTTDGRAVNVEVAVPEDYEPATVISELAPAILASDPVASSR